MKQISWKITKRVMEDPGFLVNSFSGNPVIITKQLHLVFHKILLIFIILHLNTLMLYFYRNFRQMFLYKII